MISSSASMLSSMQPFPPLGGGNLARRMFSPPSLFLFAPAQMAHQLGGYDADLNEAATSLSASRSAADVSTRPPSLSLWELNDLAHWLFSNVSRLRNREPNAEAFASVAKRISKRAG